MSEIGSVISLFSHSLPIPNFQFSRRLGGWMLSVYLYQELFVTPVTSPSSAALRKQRRHIANFRM
jgi:hypothetical protein